MIGSHTQGSQNSNHGIGSMRPLLEVLAGQGVNGICAQHLGSRHLLDPFNILPHGSCHKFLIFLPAGCPVTLLHLPSSSSLSPDLILIKFHFTQEALLDALGPGAPIEAALCSHHCSWRWRSAPLGDRVETQ